MPCLRTMPLKEPNKIFFLQPGYAHYRESLFASLSKRHNIHFLYETSLNVYPGEVLPGNITYTFIEDKYRFRWIGLIYLLLRNRPDVVISSVSNSARSVISFIYSTLFKKRFVLWILEWRQPNDYRDSMKRLFGHIKNLVGTKIIRKSDSLIVGGSAAKKYALSLGKDKRQIFEAIQCSNDLKLRAKPTIAQRTRHSNRYKFLYLSRIVPYKGLDVLIRAFSLLKHDRDDVFLMVAGDGPFRNNCQKIAGALGVHDILFVGAVDPGSASHLYEEADVFVLPSYFKGNLYEVWGLVINEAMSMSLPVITTRAVGASYDMVINGHNGFIVKDNNVMDLYRAMKNILSLDLVQMGMRSRRIFMEKNNFIRMANAFTDAITDVE